MGKGHHICKMRLGDIARAYLQLHYTPQQILDTYFTGNEVSLRHLKLLCRKFTMENTEILLSGPIKRGGRKRSHLLPIEANYLLDLFCQMDCTCLRKLHNEFKATYYVLPELAPSYDAIVRFFQSHRYSRKIMERRHIMRDEEEIMRYRELISAIRVSNLLAIDETASSPDQILEKYGYAIEGQRNVRTQFKIGSRRYSAIAAYSTRGFRHWKVVEGSVNQEVYQ